MFEIIVSHDFMSEKCPVAERFDTASDAWDAARDSGADWFKLPDCECGSDGLGDELCDRCVVEEIAGRFSEPDTVRIDTLAWGMVRFTVREVTS